MKMLFVVLFACLSCALAAPAPVAEPHPNAAPGPSPGFYSSLYSGYYPYYDHAPAYISPDLGLIGAPSLRYGFNYIPNYRAPLTAPYAIY